MLSEEVANDHNHNEAEESPREVREEAASHQDRSRRLQYRRLRKTIGAFEGRGAARGVLAAVLRPPFTFHSCSARACMLGGHVHECFG